MLKGVIKARSYFIPTAFSESNQKATIRYWHLMTMATCVMHPPNPVIFNYLNLHLKLYAMEGNTEEGQYALFCIKSLYRTCEKQVRKYPPSFKEIAFVTKRQPIEARVHLPDGHQMLIEFDSAATAEEVMQLVKAKAGMRLDAEGFGIYQVIGNTDECILPEETLADSLYKWERWAKGAISPAPNPKDIKFVFRKRLFIDPYVNIHDPVEIDLLYNQSVTDVFEEKTPLTKQDAIQLCALRAQTEFGDYGSASSFDYSSTTEAVGMSFSSVMRILPRHLRDLMQTSDISAAYKALAGLSPLASNLAFLDVLQEWPLYGATVFEVTQSSIEHLPRTLWLAVTQIGVHFMEVRGQIIYLTYKFEELGSTSSTQKNLSVSIGNEGPTLVFHTVEGLTITRLINDYQTALAQPKTGPSLARPVKDKGHGKKSRSQEAVSLSHDSLHNHRDQHSSTTTASVPRHRDPRRHSSDSLTRSKDNLIHENHISCSRDSLAKDRALIHGPPGLEKDGEG